MPMVRGAAGGQKSGSTNFGREDLRRSCRLPSRASGLVTNGIGGYASGTVGGSQTRRYHGLLIAALQPPVGPHTAGFGDRRNRFTMPERTSRLPLIAGPAGRSIQKAFYSSRIFIWKARRRCGLMLSRMRCWRSASGWARAKTRRTFNTRCCGESSAVEMDLKALVNYRDFHSLTQAGDWRMNIALVEQGVKVLAFEGAAPFYFENAVQRPASRATSGNSGCNYSEETRAWPERQGRSPVCRAVSQPDSKSVRASRSSPLRKWRLRLMAKPFGRSMPITM